MQSQQDFRHEKNVYAEKPDPQINRGPLPNKPQNKQNKQNKERVEYVGPWPWPKQFVLKRKH
jgi:hypothetical protein